MQHLLIPFVLIFDFKLMENLGDEQGDIMPCQVDR